MKTSPFQVVSDFEKTMARWAGARFGVAVDSCSSALFLSCMWNQINHVSIPECTYVAVPAEIKHAQDCLGKVEAKIGFMSIPWVGEFQLDPYPIVDSAGRMKRGMYQAGTFRCQCFHWTKALAIGKGGMILHDSKEADEWFRQARYHGRHSVSQDQEPGIEVCGWNMYLDPAYAARGLTLMTNLPDETPDCRSWKSYPINLTSVECYVTQDPLVRYGLQSR